MPAIPDVAAYASGVIAQLTGTIAHHGATQVVVEVNGVGYAVQLTPTHALELRLGAQVTIVTATIVREDAITLFGFRSVDEREVFDLLTGVSGVGPKSAMSVLAQLTPEELARAIADDDVNAFKRVPGVGPKTAKLIILNLKDKLAASSGTTPRMQAAPSATRADVVEALVGLGTQQKAAEQAVDTALQDAAAGESVQTLLRAALAVIGAKR